MIKLSIFLMLCCFLCYNVSSASLKNTNHEANTSVLNNTDSIRVDNADVGIFTGKMQVQQSLYLKPKF